MKKRKKPSNKDLKQPDVFISTTDKIVEKIYEIRTPLFITLGVALILVGSIVAMDFLNKRKEENASKDLFTIHQQIKKIDQELAEKKKKAEEQAKEEADKEKNKKTAQKNKKEDNKTKEPKVKWPRSEFDENFANLSQKYEAHISSYIGTTNAIDGALFISRLYARYHMWEDANQILLKVAPQIEESHLFYGLVHSSIGNNWIEMDKLKEALDRYEKVLISDKHQHLHENLLLKKGLIQEQMNQIEEAKITYKKIADGYQKDGEKDGSPKTQVQKSAESYLRYLEFQESFKDL